MTVMAAPLVPLYQQGWAPPIDAVRFGNLCNAPKIPLHQLGWLAEYTDHAGHTNLGADPAKIVGASAPIAATAVTAAISASAASSGAAIGAWAGPIGAGVGVLIGVIAGLWAAHEARVKGAKAENQAINSAVQTFDASIKAIFDAANSPDPAKTVPGPQAAQQVMAVYQQFWAQMVPFTRAPGAADASGGGANCGDQQLNPAGPCAGTPHGHKCDKSCTASCCVGCQDLYPTMLQAVAVLNNPKGGTVQVCTVAGSKYGANQRAGYTLTYTPPTIASAASGLLSDLFGGGSGAAGASGSGGNSTLLLIAAGIAAAMFL
jgi:hypothetical protein